MLMYFSMGHMMWGWPLPAWFDGNHIAMGLVQLLLAGIVMVINQKFFISGFRSLWHRSPNMDTLVALGSMASFVWSVYALFAMTRAQVDGNSELVTHYMMEFYFESAAMILTLITVGKMLEARSKGKTTDALKGLMKLAPKTAVVIRNGQEATVPIDHCSGDWNFKSPCRTNAPDVPKCRRADYDPASPNLVHRSFCFQIDPHPSGPSSRKILLLLYLDCKYSWNHPWLSDDHLAVGSVVFNGLYYWRLSDPSWNRLRGDGLQ